MKYEPSDYPLPLTDAQQADLLAQGQAAVDAHILETLLTAPVSAQAWIDVAIAHGVTLENAILELDGLDLA